MKKKLQKLLWNLQLCVFCFLIIASSSQAQELLGKIRVLEGGRKPAVVVDAVTRISTPDHVLKGSFHNLRPVEKPVYDPSYEIKLMNEIHQLVTKPKVTTVSAVATAPENIAKLRQDAAKIARAKLSIFMIKYFFGITIEGGVHGEPGGLWSAEQLNALMQLLRVLPRSLWQHTKYIRRVPNYMGRTSVLGYVMSSQPRVYICNSAVKPETFEQTLTHEIAHVWMFARENAALKNEYINKFWPGYKPPAPGAEQPTSTYGCSNAYEDFAEAVRCYWQDCMKMKQTHPERWLFINRHVFKGRVYSSKMIILSKYLKPFVPVP